MKIDRVRSLRVAAEWDYRAPLGEDGITVIEESTLA